MWQSGISRSRPCSAGEGICRGEAHHGEFVGPVRHRIRPIRPSDRGVGGTRVARHLTLALGPPGPSSMDAYPRTPKQPGTPMSILIAAADRTSRIILDDIVTRLAHGGE